MSLHLLTLAPFILRLLGGRGGHWHNFLPLLVTVYWFVGQLLTRLEGLRRWGPGLAAGLVVLALWPLGVKAITEWTVRPHSTAFKRDEFFQYKNGIYELVRSVPGDVLIADDVSYFLLSGKPRLMDHQDINIYERQGYAVPGLTKVARDIEQRRFDLILYTSPSFIPASLRPATSLTS